MTKGLLLKTTRDEQEMSDKERKEKRRAGERWEDLSSITESCSTGVPVFRPWKSLNPPDKTANYVGMDSVRRVKAEGFAPLIKSRRSALFASSAIAFAGISCTVVGSISLLLALTTSSPYPQMNNSSLIIGSIEFIVFGLFVSIIFGFLAIRNSKGLEMIREQNVRTMQMVIRRGNEENDHGSTS